MKIQKYIHCIKTVKNRLTKKYYKTSRHGSREHAEELSLILGYYRASRSFQNDTFHAGLRVCHGIGIRKLKPFNRCLNQAQLRGEETGTGGRL